MAPLTCADTLSSNHSLSIPQGCEELFPEWKRSKRVMRYTGPAACRGDEACLDQLAAAFDFRRVDLFPKHRGRFFCTVGAGALQRHRFGAPAGDAEGPC